MNFSIENVTPEIARAYLNTSQGNRPISKVTLNTYVDAMRKGKWMLNGEPIIFDVNGHLTNGHHRLEAVIEAGVAIETVVCHGAPTEAFTTYDCGRHRKAGQIFAMKGVKNYNVVASVVLANETLKTTGRIWANNTSSKGHRMRTNSESWEAYLKDPDGFSWAGTEAARICGRTSLLKRSWVGGLLYYLTHTGGYNRERVIYFLESINTLDTNEVPGASTLQKKLLREKIRGNDIKAPLLFAYLVKAWNAYITNRPIAKLIYDPDKEATYPRLILNNPSESEYPSINQLL